MDHNPGFSWDQIYSPPSPDVITGNLSSSSYSGSPSWTGSTLGSSPSPSSQYPSLPPVEIPPVLLAMDYNALITTHLPGLYQAFQGNLTATQALEAATGYIASGITPDVFHLNHFVIQVGNEYRCSIVACDRHQPRNGWARPDRAREHFLTDHLGAYYPCTMFGCQVKCKRVSDQRKHVLKHMDQPEEHLCIHCHKVFPKKGNLNRHIEQVHRISAARRVRGSGLDRRAGY